MGNSFGDLACGVEKELVDYDPRHYEHVLEDELNLDPLSYPGCGLYTPYELLASESTKSAILKMTLEEQASFSDAITRRYALNPHFKRLQLRRINISTDIDKNFLNDTNVTSIGNIAFMVMHNPLEPEWKEHYDLVINVMKDRWL